MIASRASLRARLADTVARDACYTLRGLRATLPLNGEWPLKPLTCADTTDETATGSCSVSTSSLNYWILSAVVPDDSSHLGLRPKEEHETELEPCHIQVVEELRNGARVE